MRRQNLSPFLFSGQPFQKVQAVAYTSTFLDKEISKSLTHDAAAWSSVNMLNSADPLWHMIHGIGQA